MSTSAEKPVLVLKPKFVFLIILFRTVFFLFFGAAFLSVASIGIISMTGGGDDNFGRVIPVVMAMWTLLYIVYIFGMVPGLYANSSYSFYTDRLEYVSGTVFSVQSRSITYARIIETGCVKGMLQMPRGMGNIIIKVAAAGVNPGPQSTVLLDNLAMTDMENADDNLGKIRELIQKKA